MVVPYCWTEIIQRQSQAKIRQLQKALANHVTNKDICKKIKAAIEAQKEVMAIVKKETKQREEEFCFLSHLRSSQWLSKHDSSERIERKKKKRMMDE